MSDARAEVTPVRLADLFRIKHGFAFKGEHFSNAPGAVVLTPGNFDAGGGIRLRPGKDRSYVGNYPKEFLLNEGELIIVMTDLTQEARILGAPAFVPRDPQCLHNQRLGKIFDLDERHLDRRYLYYVFNSQRFREWVKATATGSTVRHTSPSRIGEYRLILPMISEQQRIASILGAYDDLMEANRRRVSVLESIARGLFEEWFVRFRFPGHQNQGIIHMPNAALPDGWTWGKAADLVCFDPSTRVPSDGEKPFISMGRLDTTTSLIGEHEWRSGNSGAKFKNGDTLFARITPCLENGKTGIVRGLESHGGVGFGSTEFIVMRGGRAGAAFTYCLARLDEFRRHAEAGMSGASGRQRARTDKVAAFEIAIPPDDTKLEVFEQAAWPMLELVGKLGDVNRVLAAARDLLLSRLMSGELSVATAERELEAAA